METGDLQCIAAAVGDGGEAGDAGEAGDGAVVEVSFSAAVDVDDVAAASSGHCDSAELAAVDA